MALLLSSGCHRANDVQRYRLRGKVLAKNASAQVVTVAHKEIPGLMPAMTMPYAVKDEAVYRELQPGDSIVADLAVYNRTQDGDSQRGANKAAADKSGKEYVLENVTITETKGDSAAVGEPVNFLSIGASVPDVALTNQDGKKLRLSQFRGKAVLLTFIYTRCPLPDFCPRLSAQFAELHRELAASPNDLARTHLISITLDPKYDTPAMLRQYGLAYAGDARAFKHWDFAVLSPADLKTLANAVGLDYEEDSGLINHTMQTILISPRGVLLANWEGSQWKTADALDALRKAENEK